MEIFIIGFILNIVQLWILSKFYVRCTPYMNSLIENIQLRDKLWCKNQILHQALKLMQELVSNPDKIEKFDLISWFGSLHVNRWKNIKKNLESEEESKIQKEITELEQKYNIKLARV